MRRGILRKRYLVYITRSDDGNVDRVYIPMRYVYVLVAAAVTGFFTIAGMAGSYSRMLAKAETINRLRDELALTRKDYAHLEKKDKEKDLQVASLGSLATEVSAIYGLTAGRLSLPHGKGHVVKPNVDPAKAVLKDDSTATTDEDYYKSLETYQALQNTALLGLATQNIDQGLDQTIGVRSSLRTFASVDRSGLGAELGDSEGSNTPDMWPIRGPINSGFGQREDPVLGMGVGEFHKGVDIGSPDGTPVHAPASGRVVKAGLENGYGRVINIDHGNGIVTVYGHLQGWNVVVGQMVVKGQVIGFVGHSGKTTGSHLHYEVQIHGAAVNPHRYLQTTMASLGGVGK